jgi:hypothetical protein
MRFLESFYAKEFTVGSMIRGNLRGLALALSIDHALLFAPQIHTKGRSCIH